MSTAGCGGQSGAPSIAVGATPDAESALVAHLYAAALRSYGSPAHVQTEDDPLTELDSGEITIVPGFTGRFLARFQPDAAARSAAQVYRTMVSALPEGVAAGDYTTSAEDKPALAVTEATADAWGGRDVAAAVRHCDKVRIGQVDGVPRPQAIGTCKAQTRGYPDSATLFAALRVGEINAAWTSTAAPNIPTELLMLSDRTSLIRAENLVSAVPAQRADRNAGAGHQRGGRCAGHRRAGADARRGRRRYRTRPGGQRFPGRTPARRLTACPASGRVCTATRRQGMAFCGRPQLRVGPRGCRVSRSSAWAAAGACSSERIRAYSPNPSLAQPDRTAWRPGRVAPVLCSSRRRSG